MDKKAYLNLVKFFLFLNFLHFLNLQFHCLTQKQQCKNFNPSWSQDEIIEMLGDEALKKKVKIELPQMQQKPLFIRCLLCNNYIPSEKKTCPKCRETVWVACPKCKKQIQNGEKVCPECGFDIEREKKAREACDNARKAILKYRFEDAQNYIDNARAVYPGYANTAANEQI